jgi:drug/metabolite transporter (DMT)-like permease
VSQFLLLAVFCLIAGGNIVSIKISNQGIPPILAATIRSVVASCLLWLWARALNIQVSLPAGQIKHGVALGLLFGAQFLFLYWGLSFTDASRAAIFVFCQPLATAVMAHFALPDDRLHLAKAVGLCMSFVGLVTVFGSRSATLGELHWVGDAMALAVGLLWAANNIYIKKFVENTPSMRRSPRMGQGALTSTSGTRGSGVSMHSRGFLRLLVVVSTIASLSGKPASVLHVSHPAVRSYPQRLDSWGTIDVVAVDRPGTGGGRDLLGEPAK